MYGLYNEESIVWLWSTTFGRWQQEDATPNLYTLTLALNWCRNLFLVKMKGMSLICFWIPFYQLMLSTKPHYSNNMEEENQMNGCLATISWPLSYLHWIFLWIYTITRQWIIPNIISQQTRIHIMIFQKNHFLLKRWHIWYNKKRYIKDHS